MVQYCAVRYGMVRYVQYVQIVRYVQYVQYVCTLVRVGTDRTVCIVYVQHVHYVRMVVCT